MEVGEERWLKNEPPHPYIPRDLDLPDFVPGFLSESTIAAVYSLSSFLLVSLVFILSGRLPKLSKLDRLIMGWWLFTGLTHMVLEGYFVSTPEFYKEKTAYFLAELWKEYSKGDSRYAAGDSVLVALGRFNVAFVGPGCLLAVYAIATGKSFSCILQLTISLGQLYGIAVYFITSYLDGDNFAASMYYYYTYFIIANALWVVIPMLIVARCWRKICTAFPVQEKRKTTTR